MPETHQFEALVEEQGQATPFTVTLTGPFEVNSGQDFFYRIESAELLDREYNIYGENEQLAKEHALKFLKIFLEQRKVIDSQGQEIDWNF